MKRIAVFGAGARGKQFVSSNIDLNIAVVFDNDSNKSGTYMEGIEIKTPAQVTNIEEYQIIVCVTECGPICEQLNNMGLKEGENYSLEIEFTTKTILASEVQAGLFSAFKGQVGLEIEEKFEKSSEYWDIQKKHGNFYLYEKSLGSICMEKTTHALMYKGYCEACEEDADFRLDNTYCLDGRVAWRESCICPKCGCNSRMRYMIGKIKSIYQEGCDVYVNEYITPTYKALKRSIPGIIGSEYIGGTKAKSGDIINGILHEDAMKLSFPDESFDIIASNDVFEHVADYDRAFSEIYRCLKKNGKFIFSVPIFTTREETVTRAELDKSGNPVHIMPPDFHGNPLSDEGSLVFHEYSWDIIEFLKNSGFSDVHFIVYASAEKGYFGWFPLVIEAEKQ